MTATVISLAAYRVARASRAQQPIPPEAVALAALAWWAAVFVLTTQAWRRP